MVYSLLTWLAYIYLAHVIVSLDMHMVCQSPSLSSSNAFSEWLVVVVIHGQLCLVQINIHLHEYKSFIALILGSFEPWFTCLIHTSFHRLLVRAFVRFLRIIFNLVIFLVYGYAHYYICTLPLCHIWRRDIARYAMLLLVVVVTIFLLHHQIISLRVWYLSSITIGITYHLIQYKTWLTSQNISYHQM